MKNVNNRKELVEILSNLDMMEFIPVNIHNTTMDLFYDVEIDKFVVFDKCEWIFDTLDEVEEYIVEEYQLWNWYSFLFSFYPIDNDYQY